MRTLSARVGSARSSAPLAILTKALALTALAAPAALAQDLPRDSIPSDVRVGIVYQPSFRPGVVVPRMTAAPGLEVVADSVRTILRRDLDYSDRLEVLAAGEDVPSDGPVNYRLWDQMGAVWLLVGVLAGWSRKRRMGLGRTG